MRELLFSFEDNSSLTLWGEMRRMQKSFYDALARPFEKSEKRKRGLAMANRVVTVAFYVIYPIMLIILIALRDPRFWRVLLVPVISFLLITLFRRIVSAKRPYEVWDEPPLIDKETAGRSFPSRHVFSAFIIAMAALWLWIPAGVILIIAGSFLAVVRVIARVHFVRDVVTGAAIAVAVGIVFFWII